MRSYRGRGGVGCSAGAFLLMGLLRTSPVRSSPKFAKPRSSTVRACPPDNTARTYYGCLIAGHAHRTVAMWEGGRISARDRDRDTQLRAERIRSTERFRRMNQTLRNMYERLRRMKEQASLLDKRLRRHTEETESWHRTWDDSP